MFLFLPMLEGWLLVIYVFFNLVSFRRGEEVFKAMLRAHQWQRCFSALGEWCDLKNKTNKWFLDAENVKFKIWYVYA